MNSSIQTKFDEMERIIWDGITNASMLLERGVEVRNSLADAAKRYDWPNVLNILGEYGDLVNSTRLGGHSLYAPLHQAAHGGAPVAVVERLLAMGAWRTLRNSKSERPFDIAVRRGHAGIVELLTPRYLRTVPLDILHKIQLHLHGVIRDRIDRRFPDHRLRLPELEPLLEARVPRMWFGVPGMYGGFSLKLESNGPDATLLSTSWSRIAGGSGQSHRISAHGSELIAKGFF